jgi:hemoglobin
MSDTPPDSLYRLIGPEGFARFVAAFYARIPSDEILGPMYPPDDLAGAEARLRGFLIYRFGGPDSYIQERGHPRLRMRHAPFPINPAARDRWLKLMGEALAEANLPPAAQAELAAFFKMSADMLVNRHDG